MENTDEENDSSELHQKLQDMKKMAKKLEEQLAEKSSDLAKTTEELSVFKHFEIQNQIRIEELEKMSQNAVESEEKAKELLQQQTKQLEQTKISLEESKIEIQSLHEKLEKCFANTRNVPTRIDFENLKIELESKKHNVGVLKYELKLATVAEETNKKAMDDLAMALKEVATEAYQLKMKYRASEEELKKAKEEVENLKSASRSTEEKYKSSLQEARREAELYKSTVERLRFEAEESVMAWSGRETSLVDCIRTAEDDRFTTQQENRRLMDAMRLEELKNVTSKEEIKKLRDIVKQALNEATVAKEAAGIAIEENSQLKDCLADKENALNFVSSENETLKVTQAAALETIKELKSLVEEANKKEETKSKEKEKEKEVTRSKPPLTPSPNPTPLPAEREDTFGRMLGKAFSFSFLERTTTPEKKKEVEEEEGEVEPEMEETLKGSIFDENVDSPVSARVLHQRKPSLSRFEDVEEKKDEVEDVDQLEEGNLDELDDDRNSRKKRALIRRFGDLLTRRKSFQRKEPSPE